MIFRKEKTGLFLSYFEEYTVSRAERRGLERP